MIVTIEDSGIGYKAYYQKYYADRALEHYSWLLSDIVHYGRAGKILDLGCGTALFVELACKWGLDAMGCDGSEEALEIARRRNPKLNLSHFKLSCDLPFDDTSISNVLLNQVIEHLPPAVLSRLLLECRRVLLTGGMLFIHSPNKANKHEVSKDPTHINPLYPSELRDLLNAADFEVMAEPNGLRFSCGNFLPSRISGLLLRGPLQNWLSSTTNAYARKTE